MDIAEIRKKAKALKEMAEETGAVENEYPPEMPETPAELAQEAMTHEPEPGCLPEGVASEPEPAEAEHEAGADYFGLPQTSEPESSLTTATASEPEEAAEVGEEPARENEEPADEAEIEAISFMLDNEEYAVDIHQVKEVIKTREVTEVPRAPKDILGVISLRGVVVPVMNLRGRLGMPMKEDGERIVIVKDGADILGLLVDSVKHVVRVSEDAIEPPPTINTIDGEFIRGIGRYKGGMFILLYVEKILEKV